MRRCIWFGFVLTLFISSCSTHQGYQPPPPPGVSPPSSGSTLRSQKPYQIKGIWYYPLPSAQGYVEEGIASWYGSDFHGKATSCGEPYDMYAMTAAHKTLPLGTYVKVTNLESGKSVILKVNDRGPFVSGRIIDLSCRAAQDLGSQAKGICRVRVEAVQVASEQHVGKETLWKVDPVPSFRYGQFTIQLGAFKEPANANRLKEKMARNHNGAQVQHISNREGEFYRVQVGSFQDLSLAQQELANLRRSGFGDAFVVAAEGK